MDEKKSWIGYLWWFLYAVSVIFFTIRVSEVHFIFRSLGLILAGYFSIYYGGKFIGKYFKMSRIKGILLEISYWIVLAVLFAMRFIQGVAYRGSGDISLYEGALIQSNDGMRQTLSGAAALYSDTLSFLFAFLGNKQEVVLFFQLILQLITVIISYAVIRMLCGRIASYTAGLLLACSRQWIDSASVFSPEVVFMFFWSLLLLLIVLCCIDCKISVQMPAVVRGICLAVIGLLSGLLSYCDILGLLLLICGIYLIFTAQKQKTIPCWIQATILLIGFAAGFLIMIIKENTGIWKWILRYPIGAEWGIILPADDRILLDIMMVFVSIWIVSFWFRRKQSYSPWVLIMVLLCVAGPSFGLMGLQNTMWVIWIWAILAGLGLQNTFRAGMEKVEITAVPEESLPARTEEESLEPSRYDTSVETQYIENPLPLPKKPVRKTMGYQMEVPEYLMCYDREVTESDDYDLV